MEIIKNGKIDLDEIAKAMHVPSERIEILEGVQWHQRVALSGGVIEYRLPIVSVLFDNFGGPRFTKKFAVPPEEGVRIPGGDTRKKPLEILNHQLASNYSGNFTTGASRLNCYDTGTGRMVKEEKAC